MKLHYQGWHHFCHYQGKTFERKCKMRLRKDMQNEAGGTFVLLCFLIPYRPLESSYYVIKASCFFHASEVLLGIYK